MTDREKFEAWVKANTGLLLDRTKYPMTADEDQQYIDHDTNLAFMAWQAALASQQPADDGWIKWAGDSERPVPGKTIVEAKTRARGIIGPHQARMFVWYKGSAVRDEMDCDIIAYRVVKP